MSTPLFNTHHAPVGAWASLTFGAPDSAVSIDLQEPKVQKSGTLMVGTASGEQIRSIMFADRPKRETINLTAEGDKESAKKEDDELAPFGPIPEDQITRVLTPSCDIYKADNITFTTYTPYAALPDPKDGAIPLEDCLPGIVMDITVDNTDGTEPVTAFLGFIYNDLKRVFALDEGTRASIQFRNEWAFSASLDDAYLMRGLDGDEQLKNGSRLVHQNGPSFLCKEIPAGQCGTLTVVWSVFATQASAGNIPTDYYYNRYLHNLDEVKVAMLTHTEMVRQRAVMVDQELLTEGQDKKRIELFSQAVRAYYASTQLMEAADGSVHWNVGEGAYIWRNTMDLCADHITWELKRNPWIVRNLMDEFLCSYTYTDTVSFPDREGAYPGGISFTHDMGCYYTYSKPGYSGYERPNTSPKGFYFYMTTEELLNGIYCITAYALYTKDIEWLQSHYEILEAMITSLENRDAPTEAERNGILKASSLRGGTCGLESTTYDALDHSLLEAAGNLYVFIKTWCSLVLLKKCCALVGDNDTQSRVEAMLEKCRCSIEKFKGSDPWLKANAYQEIPGAVAAAAEPLAVPFMLGVLTEEEEPILFRELRAHSQICLQKGICLDAVSGGLRLSSTSRNTWPSKSTLTIYVMEEALGLELPASIVPEVIGWAQKSARYTTIADQILCDTREVVGALYYPRIVTAALWL